MNLKTPDARRPRVPVTALVATALPAFAGLIRAFETTMLESALAVWAWGAAIFASAYFSERFSGHKLRTPAIRISAFALLLAGVGLFAAGEMDAGLFFAFTAGVLNFGHFKLAAFTAFPIFLWTVVIPKIEYAHFLISYPMRVIGAGLSAFALSLAGIPAEAENTIVTIGGKDIAVTSACSGVDQLEGMLFVAWLITMYMHKRIARRLAHFVFILPIILLANSLRLTVTLGGNERIGDVFLSDEVHTALGYGTVILILALFVAVGTLFTSKEKPAA